MRWLTRWRIGVLLAVVGILLGPSSGSAQTFADPIMGEVRVVLICDGPSLTTGQAEVHVHTFGSPKVGPARDISLPLLQCSPEVPTSKNAVLMAVPAIWHVYLTPTTSNGPVTCETEGNTMPVASRCGEASDGVTISIAVVQE